MEIPPEVTIKASIKPGSVYYFPNEKFSSDEPHYFIVINLPPIKDNDTIVLLYASSKLEKVKKRNRSNPSQTLVTVSKNQYSDFTCTSIFDCNKFHIETIESLINRLSSGKLKLKSEMDIKLVKQLRQGVLASPLVPQEIKRKLI